MTKRENLLAAIRNEVPEVVPVTPIIHWRFTHKLLGRHHWKDTIEAHRQIGSTWFRGPISIGPNSDYDVRWGMQGRVLKEEGTETVYERTIERAKGTLRGVHRIGYDPADPTLGFQTEYFVKRREDWEVVLDYWQDEIENAPDPEHEEIDQADAIMGDDGVPSIMMNSSFARVCLMRGMEGTLIDLVDAPDMMKELLETAQRMRAREIDSFIASKSPVLVYDICWATGSGMSPSMFRDFVVPDLEKVVDQVRGAGKYIGFYTLGRIRRLLDDMVGTEPHFIGSFEPNEGDIPLGEAKQKYGKKICLMGNFDPVILQEGSLEDARREAKRCLDEGMAGGGYSMLTGCEVPTTAKVDNLKAMVEMAEKYGRY